MKTKLHQSKLKLAVLSAIVAGSMGLSTTSYAAAPLSGSMLVSTLVGVSCTMSVIGNIAFDNYDTTAATPTQSSTGKIESTCTSGGAVIITLGQGGTLDTDSTAAAPKREMKNGASVLPYNLYKDNAYSTTWGNTEATGKSFTATGIAQTSFVYAEISPGEPVISGTYSDTISVTLNY